MTLADPRTRPALPWPTGASLAWHDDVAPRPGPAQMARDVALAELVRRDGVPRLRLYTWSPGCLSFGRHEPALARYDRARLSDEGIAVVRRPTGGRAVWHDRELTYALALPDAGPAARRRTYHAMHALIADALARLGAEPGLAPAGRAPALDAGACFAHPVGGEVLLEGRKVVGSAQATLEGVLLQHGSILLADDQWRVATWQRPAAPPRAPEPPRWTALQVRRALRATLDDLAPVTDAAAGLLDAPAARHLAHFLDEAWTWRR